MGELGHGDLVGFVIANLNADEVEWGDVIFHHGKVHTVVDVGTNDLGGWYITTLREDTIEFGEADTVSVFLNEEGEG